MKTTKSFLREFSLILIFLLSVMACNKDVPNGPTPPDPGGNTNVPKVVVFDTTIISSKLDSIYDDGVLKFNGLSSTETPKIGDIICSAPAKNAPLGFLYKVKSINKTGNTTVINTDLATIEEAVKDIEISKTINLGEYVESVTNSNGQSVPLSQVLAKSGFSSGIKFEIDNTIKFKNNISCKVKGSIETYLNLKFDLSVKSWSLKMVELSIQPQVKSSLSVAVAGEVKDSIKFHIGQINLTPITFWAGAVPIVVYPVISVDGLISSVANIEIEAKIVDIDLKYTAGAKYEEGEFSFINISESKPASFLEDVELSLSGKLKLEPQLSANFKIYNQEAYLGIFSGIYAEIETDDIKLDANIIYGLEQFNPKMKFSVGLNIGPKAKLQVFSKKIADWNPTIQLLKWDLWERGMFPEFTAITFENKSQTGITAKCSMEKLSIPLLQVVEHGFCWGYGEFPTIQSDSKNQLGKVNGIGTFGQQSMKVDINALNPGTTYTIRPYFTNRLGTFYAKSEKFTTSTASSPTVNTTNPSDITLSSAKVGGNVTSDGGSNITDRGIYYSTNTVSSGTKLQIGNGTGEFSTTLSGLTPNTTYYVKAYATNSAGTSYGSILTFKTDVTSQSPTVTTTAPANITSNSATLGGNVTSAGSSAVLERGVVYATTQNPTTSNTKIASGSGTGAYSVNATNLTANTTYYVRAYAINSQGTAYGSEVNFKTELVQQSLNIITLEPYNMLITQTGLKGKIYFDENNNYESIIEVGLVISTSQDPTINNTKIIYDQPLYKWSPSAEYTVYAKNLIKDQTYYARAYAINNKGVAYGNQIKFNLGLAPFPEFKVSERFIALGETVQFTDMSSNSPTSWQWSDEFGWRSTEQNPLVKFPTATIRDVWLTVKNEFGNRTMWKVYYIFINKTYSIPYNPNLSYGTVKDPEGNTYKTIQIGTQFWMAENLRAIKFNNGDQISTTEPNYNIENETNPIYQWTLMGNERYAINYGRLYTKAAAHDKRKVCPVGWHIPSNDEWEILDSFLGRGTNTTRSLLVSGNDYWGNNGYSTNSSGFSALPSGQRGAAGSTLNELIYAVWWCAESTESDIPRSRSIHGSSTNLLKGYSDSQHIGNSIRCIKD